MREQLNRFRREVTLDRYGRKTPKHAHGTENIGRYTSSKKIITQAALSLYDRITDKNLYFMPDDKKAGGAYVTKTGRVRKIDTYRRMYILTDRTQIPMEHLFSMQVTI